MMQRTLRTTSTFWAVARLAAPLALALSMLGCALGGYDFDGYHAAPISVDSGAPAPGGGDASLGGGGRSGGTNSDAGAPPSEGGPSCVVRTCADLQAECGTVPDGC